MHDVNAGRNKQEIEHKANACVMAGHTAEGMHQLGVMMQAASHIA